MRVVLVTNNYFPYKGGVARAVHILHTLLRTAGIESYIITFAFEDHHPYDPPEVLRIESPIRFRYQQKHGVFPFRLEKKISVLLNALQPDIIHIHHPFLLGYAALQWAFTNRCPTVFTYHAHYEQFISVHPWLMPVSTRLIRYRLQSVFTNTHHIIFPSYSIAQLVHKKYTIAQSSVIPTGISDELFFMRSSDRQSHTQLRLLTVSRWSPEKGITFLLEAMRFLSDLPISLSLAGYGAEKDRLRTYAFNTCKISAQQLFFIENPSRATLIDLYQSHDIFVFGSPLETQGLVIAEAMAHSMPIIARSAPGVSDWIENNVNGHLVSSPYTMAEIIRKLYFNKKKVADLSNASYQKALNAFNTRLFIKQIDNLYRSFL